MLPLPSQSSAPPQPSVCYCSHQCCSTCSSSATWCPPTLGRWLPSSQPHCWACLKCSTPCSCCGSTWSQTGCQQQRWASMPLTGISCGLSPASRCCRHTITQTLQSCGCVWLPHGNMQSRFHDSVLLAGNCAFASRTWVCKVSPSSGCQAAELWWYLHLSGTPGSPVYNRAAGQLSAAKHHSQFGLIPISCLLTAQSLWMQANRLHCQPVAGRPLPGDWAVCGRGHRGWLCLVAFVLSGGLHSEMPDPILYRSRSCVAQWHIFQ